MQAQPPVLEAKVAGEELGCPPVSDCTGAALRMLAAGAGAKSVLEVGTGVGVSGLWLLAGMPAQGVLTSIDVEAEYHRQAREIFAEAGYGPGRVRLITGRALDILPRMASGAYDMAVIDADPRQVTGYLDHLKNIVRPGGLIALTHALWHDHVADPARREEPTVAMREALKVLRASEDWLANLMLVDDGLAVAIRL